MTLEQTSPLIFTFIFTHDLASLQRLLSSSSHSHPHPDLECLHRGQTPLTLSLMLGHHDLIPILIQAGASVMTSNAQGWTPFQESISFGNRETMALIYKKRRLEWSVWMDKQGWSLFRNIAATVGDFYAELRWQVKASIPYLSGICPWVRFSRAFLMQRTHTRCIKREIILDWIRHSLDLKTCLGCAEIYRSFYIYLQVSPEMD